VHRSQMVPDSVLQYKADEVLAKASEVLSVVKDSAA
jgi:hypothetical protein